jgi:CheY-like chemotaxis protein
MTLVRPHPSSIAPSNLGREKDRRAISLDPIPVVEMALEALVSDVGMPGQDGLALIRSVRALPASEGGRTPAVAITAFARSEDRGRALRAGFDMHVAKPFEPAELVHLLAALVGRARGASAAG